MGEDASKSKRALVAKYQGTPEFTLPFPFTETIECFAHIGNAYTGMYLSSTVSETGALHVFF